MQGIRASGTIAMRRLARKARCARVPACGCGACGTAARSLSTAAKPAAATTVKFDLPSAVPPNKPPTQEAIDADKAARKKEMEAAEVRRIRIDTANRERKKKEIEILEKKEEEQRRTEELEKKDQGAYEDSRTSCYKSFQVGEDKRFATVHSDRW